MKTIACLVALSLFVAVVYGEQCTTVADCTATNCATGHEQECVIGECTCTGDEGEGGFPGFEGGEFPGFDGEIPDFEGGEFPGFEGGEIPAFEAGEFPAFEIPEEK